MIDFIENNYQWIITTLLTLIGGGTIYILRKKNKQIIKNNSKGLLAGGDIVLEVNLPQLFIQNNFNKLCQQGKNEINASILSFLNQLYEYLKKKDFTDIISNFSSPNNLYSLLDAANIIARNNIPEKRLILCQLLTEKVRQNKEDDSDDEYTQAIKAMDKLSCKKIHILTFIEIITKVLAYNIKGTKLPNTTPLYQFIKQLDAIKEEDINYLVQIGLLYNLYPKEIDTKEIADAPKNLQESHLIDIINSVKEKHKEINFNLYTLSRSGHQIAKAYINHCLEIDYLDNYTFPLKPTTLHLDNLIVEKDVQAGGNIFAEGGVAAKTTISQNKFR